MIKMLAGKGRILLLYVEAILAWKSAESSSRLRSIAVIRLGLVEETGRALGRRRPWIASSTAGLGLREVASVAPKSFRAIMSAVKLIARSPDARTEQSVALQDHFQATEELPFLSCATLRLLTLQLGGLGFIRASALVRQHAVARAIDEVAKKTAGDLGRRIAVWSQIGMSNWEHAQELLDDCSLAHLGERVVAPARDYIALCRGRHDEIRHQQPAVDRDFRSVVAGRSIGVIGTGLLGDSDRTSAVECDVVLRLRPRLDRSVTERCDIAVLSDRMITEAVASGLLADFVRRSGCRLILGKKIAPGNFFGAMIRPFRSLTPQILTTATSGTLTIWDLVRAVPASVNLAGFDLYTGPRMYRADFEQSLQTSP